MSQTGQKHQRPSPGPVGQVAVLAGAAQDHELSVRQRFAEGLGFGAEQRLAFRRPAEAVRRADHKAVEDDAVAVAGPERLGDGVAVPDPVQELAADRVEAHVRELAREVVRGGTIPRTIAAGLDRPGPRDGGVEALVESGLAALVPQDVAVDAERVALVAEAIGVARRLARVERKLADIGLEAAGDAGGGDLANGRPRRRTHAGGREQPAEPPGQSCGRHQARLPWDGEGGRGSGVRHAPIIAAYVRPVHRTMVYGATRITLPSTMRGPN